MIVTAISGLLVMAKGQANVMMPAKNVSGAITLRAPVEDIFSKSLDEYTYPVAYLRDRP